MSQKHINSHCAISLNVKSIANDYVIVYLSSRDKIVLVKINTYYTYPSWTTGLSVFYLLL